MASCQTHGPAPLAAIAPDACWHIAGLAKCIGAGLRLAYVIAPDTRAGWSFNSAMRALLRHGLAGHGGGRDAMDQRTAPRT